VVSSGSAAYTSGHFSPCCDVIRLRVNGVQIRLIKGDS